MRNSNNEKVWLSHSLTKKSSCEEYSQGRIVWLVTDRNMVEYQVQAFQIIIVYQYIIMKTCLVTREINKQAKKQKVAINVFIWKYRGRKH